MKTLVYLLVLLTAILSHSSAYSKDYGKYLKKLQREIKKLGMQVDVYAQNPFQTGTALTNYYLQEKVLLLERDAFFQMKANKLKTTEDVADFQHRLKLLNAHGNNMLLGLMRSVEKLNEDGFLDIEQPKHEQTLEELIEECKKDSACIAERLQNPETNLENNILRNFALATQVFDQIPYMHALEANATYQLIQLVYLEAFHARAVLSGIEFKIFKKKQKKVMKQIRMNRDLTERERDYNIALVSNTTNKWKKRILERKFDAKEEFKKKAEALKKHNAELLAEIEALRKDTPEIVIPEYDCFQLQYWSRNRRCTRKKKLQKMITNFKNGDNFFIGQKEKELPRWFWKKL